MTIEAELPDGTILEFPDGTDHKVIQAAAQKYLKPAPTVGQDIKSALPYSIPKALTGLAGFPGDVSDLVSAGKKKVMGMLPEWVGQADAAVGNAMPPNPVNALGKVLPRSQALRGAAEQVTGPWYDPQTREGKIADTALQTATTLGRNWITAPVRSGLLAGGITAGTEGAGAAFNDDPYARAAGGLLGGLGPFAVNALRSKPGAIVKDAIGDLTPQQIQEAIAMQESSQRLVLPLMGTESLDRGHQLASAVYAHPSGNQNIDNFLRQRPGQVGQSVNANLIDQTGPRGLPQINAGRAQAAAEGVISDAERARTAKVQPYYEAAQYDQIPPSALRPVASEIEQQLYRQPIGSPVDRDLGGLYNQLFPNTPEVPAAPVTRALRSTALDESKDDLVTAVRKLGGLNPKDEAIGSLAQAMNFGPNPVGPVFRAQAFGGSSNRTNTVAGHSLEEMTRKLYEKGYVSNQNALDETVEKLYDASRGIGEHYSTFRAPPQDALTSSLNALVDQMKVKNAPKQSAPEPSQVLPETNVGRLNTIYKNARDASELPAIGATNEQKAFAVPASRIAGTLGDVLKSNNPKIRDAQQIYGDYTANVIDPLRSGPVGKVAGRGYDPAAIPPVERVTSAVADSSTVRPDTIKELYTHLNGQDKQAFPGIVQTHLENQLNGALGDIRSGPNPTAGAKFRQAVAGTPQDRANFEEMMRGVAKAQGMPEGDVVRGANVLLDVLDRTGRTPGLGSPTSTRGQVNEQMGRTMLGDTLSTISLNPLRPMARRFDEWIQRGRYAGLSEALTAPDSVQQLVKLAKLKPNSLSASYYAAAILGLDKAIAPGQ